MREESWEKHQVNTNQWLEKIKPHARPVWGPEVDDLLGTARANGWTPDGLAEQVNLALGPNAGPGVAITRLRNLASVKQSIDRSTSRPNGPCQIGCDHGWQENSTGQAIPCRSCRPDTYRRVTERARLEAQGAPQWQRERVMLEGVPSPRTYPTTTTTPHLHEAGI